MHVMSQLQVTGKCETLAHGLSKMRNQSRTYHITIDLEGHVCNRFARKCIRRDKFCNDVETDLKVGDCLDDSDRNEKYKCDYYCQR